MNDTNHKVLYQADDGPSIAIIVVLLFALGVKNPDQ